MAILLSVIVIDVVSVTLPVLVTTNVYGTFDGSDAYVGVVVSFAHHPIQPHDGTIVTVITVTIC